jgi:hypothetical protein
MPEKTTALPLARDRGAVVTLSQQIVVVSDVSKDQVHLRES